MISTLSLPKHDDEDSKLGSLKTLYISLPKFDSLVYNKLNSYISSRPKFYGTEFQNSVYICDGLKSNGSFAQNQISINKKWQSEITI